MSASSSTMHNPPSVSSVETPLTEHDDVSVTASDDIDVRSSITTDPSVTEQDQTTDDKPTSSPKSVSPSASRGPVQLLRRQPNSSGAATPASRQSTPTSASDVRQPSPSRVDNGPPTPGKDLLDPSLLEAFANPMNRQYLLQLEGSLNSFVTQSRLDTLELPPTNSFFRCLAHKMADHYRLQHVAESGHVVLFRSPYARIPETRLSELSKTVRTSGSSASSNIGAEDSAPTIPTPEIRQIMKRVPGKSGRDGEDDAKSESSQSQVLSHEERQAKYEQTRARIFSDYVASQGSEAAEKGSEGDGGSETSSMRQEKSLHRSDSFQTRQQFARDATSYSSYAAALTGPQSPPQQPQHPISPPTGVYTYSSQPGYAGYQSYPTQQFPQQYPYTPMSQTTRDQQSKDSSRPDSRTSSPATNRNDSPGFQPNPFAREFVPTGASGGGSGNSRPPIRPRHSLTPPIASRKSTPPNTTQQVKKTASFENGPPITPTPVYARSQSASSMRPQPPQPLPQHPYSTPPVYPAYGQPPPPQQQQMLPLPPPILLTARQYDWGPSVTTGTVRYIANGQPIPPQILPYRAHPMPAATLKPFHLPPQGSQLRNGNSSQEAENTPGQVVDNISEKLEGIKIAEDGIGDASDKSK